jgi:hypothetical protein
MPPQLEDELAWLRHFIDTRRWQRGKADPSHEYTVKDWVPDGEQDFERVVAIIESRGEPGRFWSRTFIYLQIDALKYWTMGDENSQATVVNRAES